MQGKARPAGQQRVFGVGDQQAAAFQHAHDTALMAVELGITTVDSSLGGIGGCPWAPRASGNIVTEDLVFLLESMGLKTGIDINKLLEVRALVQAALPDEPMYGFVPEAGLPKGFRQSA